MKFYPRRRRAAPAVIIISLIDVLVVMLVFMMVSTTFKNAPAVKVTLPETSGAPKVGATMSRLPLEVWITPTNGYFFGSRPVTSDQLFLRLREMSTNAADTKVVIRADGDSTWQQVVKVLDYTRQLHLTNVQAYTRGEGAR
jgi:biopolymer transport protein ExbD